MSTSDKNNDADMKSAHEWLAHVAHVLDLPADVERHSVGPILDLTKDVAHNRSRPSAPVTAFLVGLSAGLRISDQAEGDVDKQRLLQQIDDAIAKIKEEATA